MLRIDSHILNTVLGSYSPSIFKIMYNQEGSIINTEYEYILFHEYIHFLQDISTNYGKTNLCNYYGFVKEAILELQKMNSTATVNLPLQFHEEPLYCKHSVSASTVFGNTRDIYNIIDISTYSLDAKIYKKKITLYNLDDAMYTLCIGNREFYIGAADVLENMAYLLERMIYSDTDPAPNYPYRTIEILTKSIYPKFYDSPELICALCELSLSTSNPGRFYFDSLFRLKESGAQIDSIDDLMQLFNSSVSFRYLDKTATNIETLNYNTTEDATTILRELFPEKAYNELSIYIVTMFKNALDSRIKDPLFITRGAISANPREYYFSTLPRNIGVPMIFDKYNDLYMQETAPREFLLFTCISTFINIFILGKTECDLFKGCVRNMNSSQNSHNVSPFCLTAPWRLSEKEKLCPLASLIAFWGIDGKNYQCPKISE